MALSHRCAVAAPDVFVAAVQPSSSSFSRERQRSRNSAPGLRGKESVAEAVATNAPRDACAYQVNVPMVDVTAVYAFRGVDAMAFKRLEVDGVREPVQFIEIVDEILESERPAPSSTFMFLSVSLPAYLVSLSNVFAP